MTELKTGLAAEAEAVVDESALATQVGSGSVPVYATPAMLALMEAASVAAIQTTLAEGQTSVGVALDVRHLAATPAGQLVRARAEVTAVDGRTVTFAVQAWDEQELIGQGTHTRYVIEVARFMQRVEAKGV